jgi:cysteinyl-tRNA synthetase
MLRPVYLFDSLTDQEILLKTLQPGSLSFYSCGPTVYSYIHLGNLRSALVADMFFKYFKRVGYVVKYVRNYTDIDDKIIQKALEENVSSEAVAEKYILEVEKDYCAFGIAQPTHQVRVTDHLPEIISMIQRLLDRKRAYEVEGEVFYSVQSDCDYGKLAHKKISQLEAGVRVEVRENKKNPLDFTLWKPAKPGEPSWPSPWGLGRPGWHIECSAMAEKFLGPCIDIHHGGRDLLFPHHENERAQTEGATGEKPFVGIWMHHAFLTFSQEKMSKSLGNTFTARSFLEQFSAELARYFLLSVHYRSMIDLSSQTLENAIAGLERIYEAQLKAQKLRASLPLRPEEEIFLKDCQILREQMDEYYARDFNTPSVLASVFTMIRKFNRLTQDLSHVASEVVDGFLRILREDLAGILGFGGSDPEPAWQDLQRMRGLLADKRLDQEAILKAIEARLQARQRRDFQEADAIRQRLSDQGVAIQDGPDGTTWKYL